VKEVLNKAPSRPQREQRGKEKEREAAVEEEAEAPIPTAMEMALREAMERKNVTTTDLAPKKRRKGSDSQELEGILSRTLKSRSN
jgi:hypothetical protein